MMIQPDEAYTEYRVTWFPDDAAERHIRTTDLGKALRWAPGDNPIVEAREVGPLRTIHNPTQGIVHPEAPEPRG